MSSRFARLVVPMMGALTPGFVSIQASEICAMLTPFFFASSSILEIGPSAYVRGAVGSTYLDVSSPRKGMSNVAENLSVLPRTVASREVRVSRPRPSGDQGIEPTPNV